MSLDQLFDKRLLLVSGKGGVGKTIVSSSLALEASRTGKSVCLVQAAAEDQMGPLFGVGQIGHGLTPLGPGIHGINLDSDLNFRDFVVLHLGFERMFDKVFTNGLVRSFVGMMPGIAEITLLGRLLYYLEEDKQNKFDLVILDGFSSGHFLSLMSTPGAILNAGFSGPIVTETNRVQNLLKDKTRVGIVTVTQPESLIISETKHFIEEMSRNFDSHIAAVFVNRYLPDVNSEDLSILANKGLIQHFEDKNRRIQESTLDLRNFVEGSLGDCNLFTLPDLGVIREPLEVDQVSQWFKNGAQWSLYR